MTFLELQRNSIIEESQYLLSVGIFYFNSFVFKLLTTLQDIFKLFLDKIRVNFLNIKFWFFDESSSKGIFFSVVSTIHIEFSENIFAVRMVFIKKQNWIVSLSTILKVSVCGMRWRIVWILQHLVCLEVSNNGFVWLVLWR